MVKLRARCILVGDATVGKSALSQMFRSDGAHFQKIYSMTTGVELLTKSVSIPDTSDSVELFILDSPGREVFAEAYEKMWGQPSAMCLVFDISSEMSFRSCGRWLERVRAHAEGLQVPGVLVGNKSDLSTRREVEISVAQEWAHSQRLEYFETSAVKRDGKLRCPFAHLAQAFYNLYHDETKTIHCMVSP